MGLIGDWRERRAARAALGHADRLFRHGDQLRRDEREAEAEAPLAEAVRIRSDLLGPAAPATSAARLVLARVLRRLHRYAEAESELRTLLAAAAPLPAGWKTEGLARMLLGDVLLATHRTQQAISEMDAFLDLAERHHFGRLPLQVHSTRALAYGLLGCDTEAATQYAELAEAWTAEGGPEAAQVMEARASWALHMVRLGHYEEAETECRELIRAAIDPNQALANTDWSAWCTLALALIGQGQAAEAEALLREVVAGADPAGSDLRQLTLVKALNAQRRYGEALSAAETGEATVAAAPRSRRGYRSALGLELGTAQLGLGRADSAILEVDRALADCHAVFGQRHHRALELGTLRGRVLAAQGHRAEARAELTTNAAAWRTHFGTDHPLTAGAEQALGALDHP
ncbi:hypothetical protein CFP65_0508 [Kitasatospora sp. MMS16-BH015]|uniref:tetratricopeptide repeat protein n=1 Tax=Kitasatospora sp. MMS16-BH015 TaxID=2018025 RepID=UPI000CA2A9D0|nr:tetratricopeptide repeat protein [Kitasatospora sp. MMS16-BH015]AUG75471.1 hypothetical protein CFP65_0508 [Kitasatospora sp. MMS16-BH015]